jgi:uncharacterized membrane protein
MNQPADTPHPYTILAFCFADQARAGDVMKELKAGKILEAHQVVAAAVVEVDKYGKTHVQQHGRGGVGAATGIMAGEALALIGGPAGLLVWAVAGGAIGGAVGHFVDRAFTKEDLTQLKDRMSPNSSAILTMAKDIETSGITTTLQPYQAIVVTLALDDEATGAVDQSVVADMSATDAPDSSAAEKSD